MVKGQYLPAWSFFVGACRLISRYALKGASRRLGLVALSLLAAQCKPTEHSSELTLEPPLGTSIAIRSDVNRLYPYQNPTSADFKNFTYHPTNDSSFRLENGRFEETGVDGMGYDLTELMDIYSVHPVTIVHISDYHSYVSSACSEYLFFFSTERSPLTLLSIVAFRCSVDSTEYNGRVLRIRALSDREEDGNCCPRFVDEVQLEILNDGRLKILGWSRRDNPEQTL